MKRIAVLMMVISMCVATRALAEEPAAPLHGTIEHAGAQATVDMEPHPDVSTDSTWAGLMIVVIIGLFFVPAAVIGPIVRVLNPPQTAPAHSHDDAHGATAHHDSGHGHGH
jgi:hypothetical protein